MLVTLGSPNLEDFYPAVAISTLMRIMRDSSLANHHTGVVQAITFIFKSLGVKCVQFLPQIMPTYIYVIRTCDPGIREVEGIFFKSSKFFIRWQSKCNLSCPTAKILKICTIFQKHLSSSVCNCPYSIKDQQKHLWQSSSLYFCHSADNVEFACVVCLGQYRLDWFVCNLWTVLMRIGQIILTVHSCILDCRWQKFQ